MTKKNLKTIWQISVYFFAIIGLILVAGFLAVKFHLTDSWGQVDFNDRYFATQAKSFKQLSLLSDRSNQLTSNLCRAQAIKKLYPENGTKILLAYDRSRSDLVLAKMLASAELYLSPNSEYQNLVKKCADSNFHSSLEKSLAESNLYAWINTPEWQTLKEGLIKDKDVIMWTADKTNIPARLIVSQIVGEQLRLFHTEREVYKLFFQPLKILGNEIKFSLGVAGIKEETAIQIEKNLVDRTSDYYLGPEFEKIIIFQTADVNQERFNRLTDSHDHTYSYLYTALFLKQIQAQWQKAGFDISDRPEILATIFNVGYDKSVPKADPQVGGSEIAINGKTYTFGSLAYEFYYSGELLDEFPVK